MGEMDMKLKILQGYDPEMFVYLSGNKVPFNLTGYVGKVTKVHNNGYRSFLTLDFNGWSVQILGLGQEKFLRDVSSAVDAHSKKCCLCAACRVNKSKEWVQNRIDSLKFYYPNGQLHPNDPQYQYPAKYTEKYLEECVKNAPLEAAKKVKNPVACTQ